ncbi:MAG: MarR family winged helix-turn-helix transcriptional regulator [Kofleriaceae bacterium]
MIPTDEVAQEVLRSIRQIVRSISIHSKTLQRDVGLTVPQLLCLRALFELERDDADEITVADISERVHLSPATVSRIIDRLVAAGLVIRERGTIDRRRVSLSLTAAGMERVQTLPSPLQEKFLRGLGELPRPDQLQLLASLRRVAALMDAIDLDAAPLLAPDEDVKS